MMFQRQRRSGWSSDVTFNQPLNEKRSLVERGWYGDIYGQVSDGCHGLRINKLNICTTCLRTVLSIVILMFILNNPNSCM